MMANFWGIVNKIIQQSDVVLEVLDSRLPELTRNPEVEEKVKTTGKKLILVLNKCDLIGQKTAEHEKKLLSREYPVIFVSTKEHQGTKLLREAILMKEEKQELTVGVLGYPNTGKSSLINVLKGRKSASTSAHAGHTRALQRIRITNRIMMLDSPGVIPFEEKDEVKHVLIGAKMFSDIKNPDIAACELIDYLNRQFPAILSSFYSILGSNDSFTILEQIAEKRNLKSRGDVFDTDKAARLILQDWQLGKIVLG